jgi:crotonobetainyl-CoA:carnitine CoA-transferase CaiB-like acyl-CoA transferase
MAFNISLIAEEALRSIDRPAYGNRGYSAGPSDVFKTTDGAVMVQVVGQPLFERWAKLMKEDSWLNDPRFATDMDRGENGELLSARMQMWCKDMTTKEVLDTLDEARIPCGPVLSAKQVLEDPHIKAMDFLENMEFPGLNKPIPITTTPIKLSRTPGTIRKPTAMLGEHTDTILKELNYTEDQIAEMRKARAV